MPRSTPCTRSGSRLLRAAALGAGVGSAATGMAASAGTTRSGSAASEAAGSGTTVARLAADGGVIKTVPSPPKGERVRVRGSRRHELRRDELIEVRQLANLLLLVHELRVGPGTLDELRVDLPGELDVRRRHLDRLAGLAELLHRHLD